VNLYGAPRRANRFLAWLLKDASGGNGMPSSLEVPAATAHPPPEGMDRSFFKENHQVLEKKQVWALPQPR
jgi:hypothetical protein